MEAVEDGIVVADITGTEKLFGSPRKLVSTIATRAAEFGFALNIGIASNPDTAVHIARGYSGITIVEPGEEAASLATLPIEVLAVSPEMMEVLDAWGIRNCKALATLPSIPLVERLGAHVLGGVDQADVHRVELGVVGDFQSLSLASPIRVQGSSLTCCWRGLVLWGAGGADNLR